MTRCCIVGAALAAVLAALPAAANNSAGGNEQKVLMELKKLAQPTPADQLKGLSSDEIRALHKKRAEEALKLVKDLGTANPKNTTANEARSEALKIVAGVDDPAIANEAIKVAKDLKDAAPKGSDLAAQAELYLLSRAFHAIMADVKSVETFRTAWDKYKGEIRKHVETYLAEYPKYRPGADAIASLVRMAEVAGDTDTAKLISETIARNLPEHPLAKALARENAVGKEFDFAFTPVGSKKEMHLKDLRGKVVVVNFWASWCVPCRNELAHLRMLYEKHRGDGLEIVGVSLDEKDEAAKKFLADQQLPWQQVIGEPARHLGEQWGIEQLPTVFVIDRSGRLSTTHGYGKLDELLPKLLTK